MSIVRVWIHAVWGTKNRRSLLTEDVRTKVLRHIRENAKAKEIYVDRLNGYTDHVHCLFALNADMSVSKALQLMKGESAHWANEEHVTRFRFEWANEYYAVSVSETGLGRLRAYIDNQEEHHRKKTYAEEVDELMQQHHQTHHS
jgi:REP element-mobilizing transposase RayT